MKVNAKYWLNIFDLEHGQSAQRPLQNHYDKPHTLFFAKIDKAQAEQTEQTEQTPVETHTPELLPLNLTYTVSDMKTWQQFGRLVLFPLDRNLVLVRVQNSADKFDMNAPELTVNVDKLAWAMWASANPGSKDKMKSYIKEVSLSANMAFKEVLERREKM